MSSPDLYLEDQSFHIAKEQQSAAYLALKHFAVTQPDVLNAFGYRERSRPYTTYSEVVIACSRGETLSSIFSRLGFILHYDDPRESGGWNYGPYGDEDHDIVGIELEDEARDRNYDEILFPLVAPFVFSGSYLEFRGHYEDDYHWKLCFQEVNGVVECRGVEPIITWPDPFQSEVKEDDDYHYPNAHTL